MCVQQFKLSTEAFDFYGRALFQRRTSRMFLRKSCIPTEQARFFYKKEQVIDNTIELDFHGRSSRQSTQRSQIFLRNDLSLLYRTVRFIQNTTIFFKEREYNFRQIGIFILRSYVPSGPPYPSAIADNVTSTGHRKWERFDILVRGGGERTPIRQWTGCSSSRLRV